MNSDNFYKNKSSKDGLTHFCKECTKEVNSNWRKNNPEKRRESWEKYDSQDFVKEKNRIATRRYRKTNKYKDWKLNNKEKLNKYSKNRYQNKKHIITKKEWIKCLEYFDYCCAYCGITEHNHLEKYNQHLHKEHVDHNGANDLSNCVPSCKECNSSKKNKNINQWYKSRKFFDIDKLNKINLWILKDYKNNF